MSIQTNLGQINCVLDWTCPSNTQGIGFTHPALSVCRRGHGAGCLAEGLWVGLRSAWLQLWAKSWSACQPLYGNEQGQSKGSAGQEFSSMFLQRAAVCKLYFSTAAPIPEAVTVLQKRRNMLSSDSNVVFFACSS